MTHPELTTFIPGIVPDLFNVRGVYLHFIRRNHGERHVGYIEDSIPLQQYCFRDLYRNMHQEKESHLGLGITMVDSINKAVSAQGISKLGIELLASFRCVGFGKVDDSQVGKLHYSLSHEPEIRMIGKMFSYNPH